MLNFLDDGQGMTSGKKLLFLPSVQLFFCHLYARPPYCYIMSQISVSNFILVGKLMWCF